MIDSYRFGNITIDGAAYSKDVIIKSKGVLSPWWRGEGHNLMPDDLREIESTPVNVLVIGTGSFGVMKVSDAALGYLRQRGIEPRVMRTGKAVEEFNRLLAEMGPDAVAAALHLTC